MEQLAGSQGVMVGQLVGSHGAVGEQLAAAHSAHGIGVIEGRNGIVPYVV